MDADGRRPVVDAFPLIRLWQAVILLAVNDASHANEHQSEARLWMRDPIFCPLCEFVGFNPAEIKSQINDPDLYDRIRKTCKRPPRSLDE